MKGYVVAWTFFRALSLLELLGCSLIEVVILILGRFEKQFSGQILSWMVICI